MKRLVVMIFFCVAVVSTIQAQQFSKTFKAEHKYLRLPIKNGAAKRNVDILVNNEKIRWFTVELADQTPDWYAYLDISAWKGRTLTLNVDVLDEGSKAFSPIEQVDVDENSNVYKERRRGQFHFSPKRGWNNDPNGLVYYKGEYHMFFQHNPYGVNWGNMHWGHAVSKDLVHWQEFGEALYPDTFGTMFSGGGVVDSSNTSGLGNSKNSPLILYYTAAENSWKQGLAYTVDGRVFEKLETPVLDKITDGNRDPKVIWHAPSKQWVMVLYVTEEGDQHTMHFFTSKDMKSWTFASKIIGGQGNDRYLFECPEFFELPVDGGGEKKWVLTGANSQYAIGTFDGKVFRPEEERLFSQHGRDYYAAQTISDEPKGRRVEIGWWRTRTDQDGSSFNQSMSIPMELALRKTDRGIRMVRKPIDELQQLRQSSVRLKAGKFSPTSTNLLTGLNDELAEIRLKIRPENAKNIHINIRGLAIEYQVADEELVIDHVRTHVPLINGEQDFVIYVDRTGIELFASKGEIFMPINYNLDSKNRSYNLRVSGGEAVLLEGEIHQLKSIW
ncbi:DUF4980 domain-containing protein [Sphingobacterium sp. LRF_L2]|uniref:DUF4980 domain-containing protein n=1 Tax=Sphingobacterium sp. LRF_L2 TaxID=3369421 RepID=UPI003F61E64E